MRTFNIKKMCGIAGKIKFNNQIVEPEDLYQMTAAIAHRGPDDEGIWISPDKKVGLGHRRLAIIDLTSAGHQPMSWLNERYWIVFNGEIYNFQQIRRKLEKENFKFSSKTDTEVILALYHKHKENCLKHLRGMFAFAIWDDEEKILFAARDRIGKKPFKYYWDAHNFIFASELKAILTQPEYRREPDYEAIHHYLSFQYAPAPMTGFKNIKKLLPGHYFKINVVQKKFEIKRYWEIDYSQKLNLSEDEWKEKIFQKLEESVKMRLISDVSLGAFLSGGIDSSAVVAMMAKLSAKPVKTFSIGFKEKKFDETNYAKIIANKFKTEHAEFVVEPKAIEILPKLVWNFEEPYADSSALPVFYLSKLTRQSVKVALNGDGGDENFAGYTRYLIFQKYLSLKKLTTIIKNPHRLIPKLAAEKIKLLKRIKKTARNISLSQSKFYFALISYFQEETKVNLYRDEFSNEIFPKSSSIMEKYWSDSQKPPKDYLDKILYADFHTYLCDDLLVKVDIATMAVALENRSPLLDHEFVELCAKIPQELKLTARGEKKYIFKKALEPILPREIIYRKKMGFGVPLNEWLRGELNKFAEEIILSQKALARGIFKPEKLKKFVAEHTENHADHGFRLWALLTLELWFREFFD